MSLKKEICMKCKGLHYRFLKHDENDKGYGWHPTDELRWIELQVVECPDDIELFGHAREIDGTPEWCPYALEHMVIMQDE